MAMQRRDSSIRPTRPSPTTHSRNDATISIPSTARGRYRVRASGRRKVETLRSKRVGTEDAGCRPRHHHRNHSHQKERGRIHERMSGFRPPHSGACPAKDARGPRGGASMRARAQPSRQVIGARPDSQEILVHELPHKMGAQANRNPGQDIRDKYAGADKTLSSEIRL